MNTINPHATIDNLSEEFNKRSLSQKVNPNRYNSFGLPPRLEIATRLMVSRYGNGVSDDTNIHQCFYIADEMIKQFNKDLNEKS